MINYNHRSQPNNGTKRKSKQTMTGSTQATGHRPKKSKAPSSFLFPNKVNYNDRQVPLTQQYDNEQDKTWNKLRSKQQKGPHKEQQKPLPLERSVVEVIEGGIQGVKSIFLVTNLYPRFKCFINTNASQQKRVNQIKSLWWKEDEGSWQINYYSLHISWLCFIESNFNGSSISETHEN